MAEWIWLNKLDLELAKLADEITRVVHSLHKVPPVDVSLFLGVRVQRAQGLKLSITKIWFANRTQTLQ